MFCYYLSCIYSNRQLALMAEDYFNTYGNELAARQQLNMCVQQTNHKLDFTVALDTSVTARVSSSVTTVTSV
jgi:hypothetical protein